MATPLGNLRDITLRALDVLGAVDYIAAEDTRLTQKLLQHYNLSRPMIALHQHNEIAQTKKIIDRLASGKSVALVCDSGTPSIQDPGAITVQAARDAGFHIVPIPGPCAAITAISVSGGQSVPFFFYGFLPIKSTQRKKALHTLRQLPYCLVFYEAPHRILETIEDLAQILDGDRIVVIARELTKIHETLHRCALSSAEAWLKADHNRCKGEFVLVVEAPQNRPVETKHSEVEPLLSVLLAELPPGTAAKLAAKLTGQPRDTLYAQALALQSRTR